MRLHNLFVYDDRKMFLVHSTKILNKLFSTNRLLMNKISSEVVEDELFFKRWLEPDAF